MIRLAETPDMPEILRIFSDYQKEVRPDLNFDLPQTSAMCAQIIDSGFAVVLDIRGVCGVALGIEAASLWWRSKSSELLFWWVDKRARGGPWAGRMLGHYEQWAADRGVKYLGVTYAGKSADVFLVRHGYRHAEGRAMKELG